jgi:antitoxin (DNA-binding transcriptional repressor) of toxin-antitoxin stability system
MMIRSVNIRALKDHLSAHLRDVQRGDIVLVTDRGRVVAELREPTVRSRGEGKAVSRLQSLADRGLVRLGLPNVAGAYGEPAVHVPARVIADALDWTRGER